MEKAELITTLISTAITATGIILIWLLQFIIKKITTKNKAEKTNESLENLVNYILEAELKLGKGQGKAKMLYVLNKLGKKETNKKAIEEINKTHKIIETVANKGE